MFKRLRPPVAWLAGLLLASLWLAACGGTAQSTPQPQEQVAANQTTEATATTPATAEVAQAATATEEVAIAEPPATAASPTAKPPAAPKQAICQAIEIPTNDKAATVTTNDWSKGSANAPITLIEYADFQ